MITVVIPAYNRRKELWRALRSLAEQTEKNFKVLVCDDGSEDDIKSVAKSFMPRLDLRYLCLDHSGGPASPRNAGIAFASSEWISFLDSDDWWCPDRIKIVYDQLTSKVDLIYHQLKIVSGSMSKLGWNRHIGRAMGSDPLTDMLSRGNPIPTSSAVVRRSLLLEINGFSTAEALVSFEDFDTWLLLARHGARFQFINRNLGYYWIGSDNIGSATNRQINRQEMLFARHCNNLPSKVAAWAQSYNNYVIGTYLLKLGRPQDALTALKGADHLRFHSQRLKRVIKIIMAAFKHAIRNNV